MTIRRKNRTQQRVSQLSFPSSRACGYWPCHGYLSLVGIVAALFVVISLSEPLADRTRLPYTVVLAIIGGLIGTAAINLPQYGNAFFGWPLAVEVFEFSIRANVFPYVLLPTLLFQVALGLNLRRMADDWVPILVMAVVAVVVATLAIGFALTPFTTLPLVACFMLGAIVATTDPSAGVSIFRNIAAPQSLTRIVEGESLLNDAATIALFGFFLTYVMLGVPNPTLRDALVGFPLLILGGIGTGWALARLCLGLFGWLARFPLAQISLSVALPYVTYLVADRLLGVSGVIAVVMAGMTLNYLGPGRLSPVNRANLRRVMSTTTRRHQLTRKTLLNPRLLRCDLHAMLVRNSPKSANAPKCVRPWTLLSA